jgi:glucokinase
MRNAPSHFLFLISHFLKDVMENTLYYALGLDVGGTKIAGGIVALASGQILERRMMATGAQRGGEAVLMDVLQMVEQLFMEAAVQNLPIAGIGLGVCELVDRAGQISSGHTVAWKGLPVQARLAEYTLTAVIEADVRAHALAEAHFGAGRDYGQFIFVTVGTGISSCLVQDGRPYPGANGNALILASSPLTTQCPHCGAILQPVLEQFASGPAMVARYNAATGSNLRRAEELLAAQEQGDETAAQIISSAGEALGAAVAWLVNVLDPEAVILGGGLGSAVGPYWHSFVTATRAHIWAESSQTVPILPATLGPDAGVIGAALAVERVLGY